MRLETIISAPVPRFVVVHYHIFKNGGSTIESILEREFDRTFATLHGPDASSTLDAGHLESFLQEHPEIQAVSSHHLRYPKPSIRHTVIFDCCFLRHPLDRVDSMYWFLRESDARDELSERARRQGPREFLRFLLAESPHLLADIQVNQLACSGVFTRPAHAGDLDRASEMFCEAAIPGLVEMFDLSLMSAEYFLRPAFPALRLEYTRRNARRVESAGQTREERLARCWGPDLYQDLARLNQLDLELFDRAEREIRRRAALVPGCEQRLAEFKGRCSRLGAGQPASVVEMPVPAGARAR
jgi:hypothetical protein